MLWTDGDGSRRNKGREVAVSGLCNGMVEYVTGSWGDRGKQGKGIWDLATPHLQRLLVPARHPVRDMHQETGLVLTAIL